MIKNLFLVGWRNARKSGLYSVIKVLGLTVGITSCILIGLYIALEISYDRFQSHADRIVRVTMEYSVSGTIQRTAVTGTKVGPQFKRAFPEVEAFTRIKATPSIVSNAGQLYDEQRFLYVDSSFFQVFSFKLLRGNPNLCLNEPNKLVLTETMAKKYFGKADPLGKVLQVSNSKNFTVTGVAADAPENSQIHFDFLASFSSLDESKSEEWWTANYFTYLLITHPDPDGQLQGQVTNYMKADAARKEAHIEGSDYLTYHLEPLKKVHLYSSLDGLEPNGSITYVKVLGAVALLILLVACVNYTNLATAQSAARSGEISIRKVLGARHQQLFGQHLGESAVITFIALLLSVVIAILLLPLFNLMTGKTVDASVLMRPAALVSLIGLGLFVSILAGGYPALVLSNLNLTALLKSGFRTSSASNNLRQSLIVFQFVISVFLIVSTLVILRQIQFIHHKNLGYDKDHVLVLPVDRQMHTTYEGLKTAMSQDFRIKSVSGASGSPVFVLWTDGIQADNGKEKKNLTVKCIPSDLEFVKTLGIDIVAGRAFTPGDWSDLDTSDYYRHFQVPIMLNQAAVKALGWTPEQAIGKTVSKGGRCIIKAVVKDFHFTSMHEEIGPLMLFLDTQWVNRMYVKVSGLDIPGALSFLAKVWKERVPYRPFEYHFLDEDFNELYKVETRTAQLFSFFSLTAIVLACLGLFGLAAFTTVQRIKEIGIRKVLGATLWNIAGMLSADFLKLVVLASLIAFPLAWYAMRQWLEDFAYRTALEGWIFGFAGLAALIIALITVSFQAIKAASASPVRSLRSE